jgi:hypothetical protein
MRQYRSASVTSLYVLTGIDTLNRMRRHIQNTLKLFPSTLETRRMRDEIALEWQQIIAADREGLSEIRFYLDETAGSHRFNGIGGVCAMNWNQYSKYWSSIAQWRREQVEWPGPIHVADINDHAGLARAMSLVHQIEQRRGGLLFLGYGVESKAMLHETRFSLFIQLVIDSLHKMDAADCLGERRSVVLIKEEESGFDRLFLEKLHAQLERQLFDVFPHRVYLQEIRPQPKGSDVLLECADVLAASMTRWHLHGGFAFKDDLSRAVFRVTGLPEPKDGGVVFKIHPA